MSDESQGPAKLPSEAITVNRRKAVVRYVEFRDVHAQQLLLAAAEHAYQALVGSDTWGGIAQIEARTAPAPPARKVLFRRPRRPAALPMVPTTPALARVDHLTANTPRELEASPNGCSASHGVAQILASVASDLVRELVALPPDQQAAHSAYRQTLRLAAELEGLRDVVLTQTCTDLDACVGIRSPGHLDRRVEDAEVAEVLAVLLQLARAAEAEPPRP